MRSFSGRDAFWPLSAPTFSGGGPGEYKPEPQQAADGVFLYKISMRWDTAGIPAETRLRFLFPALDTLSVFDCRRTDRAKSWGGAERVSRLGADLPLLQLNSAGGQNRTCLRCRT